MRLEQGLHSEFSASEFGSQKQSGKLAKSKSLSSISPGKRASQAGPSRSMLRSSDKENQSRMCNLTRNLRKHKPSQKSKYSEKYSDIVRESDRIREKGQFVRHLIKEFIKSKIDCLNLLDSNFKRDALDTSRSNPTARDRLARALRLPLE